MSSLCVVCFTGLALYPDLIPCTLGALVILMLFWGLLRSEVETTTQFNTTWEKQVAALNERTKITKEQENEEKERTLLWFRHFLVQLRDLIVATGEHLTLIDQ